MKTYNINKDSMMVIYGAGYIGCTLLDKIHHAGYSINAFLDKNAEKLKEVNGINVFHPDDYYQDKDKSGIIVLIATGNPVSVANYLFNLGYRKIIYNTFLHRNSNKLIEQIRKVYNSLMQEGYLLNDIPFYDPDLMDNRFIDYAYITHEDKKVIAYISTDLLFDSDGEHVYGKFFYLNQYLRAFDGNVSCISRIVDQISKEFAIEELSGYCFNECISDRRLYSQTQFNILNQNLNYGMDWFIQNPIHIVRKGDKYVVEKKDLFTVCFFLAKGLTRIPASFLHEDYQYLINKDKLTNAIIYVKEHDLLTSYTPLEHPYFYSFPAARDIGGNARMIYICKWIYEHKVVIDNKKIIDIGSYFGFLSRFFCRMGAKVTSVEFNKDTYGMGVVLNQLMHFDGIETIYGGAEEIDRKNDFDITIMLTVLYWHLNVPLGKKLISAVDNMTKKYLIWESGDEPEKEKQFIFSNSHFNTYEHICETTGTGKVREMGVFIKNG